MTTGSRSGKKRSGRLWRLLGRPEESEVPDLLDEEPEGAEPNRVCDCQDSPEGRPVVTVSGRLRSVSERTVGGLPALEAELDDGSGVLGVVWLGRRTVAGIVPGRELTASGRVAISQGRPVLFNPRYELRPLGTE